MAASARPASQVPRSNNRVHLFRLLTLTIDEGTSIVRNIFDDKRPKDPLDVFLANERQTINQLSKKKTITKSQYYLLFPQTRSPTTADFDLTLTICLLRNLNHFGLNQAVSWNAIPHTRDTSLEADLRRLQITRNELAHISATNEISEPDFENKWNDIENALLRLNASLQNIDPNLKQRIKECKNKPPDLEALERINSEVGSLRQDVDNLSNKTDDMHNEMQTLKTNQEKLISSDGESRTSHKCLQTRKRLEKDLIFLYRDRYHTLPLSPLIEEHDRPLLYFYIMPDINVVESQVSSGVGGETKSKVKPWNDVFYKKTKMCRKIYLVADAGLGKTAFSRRLTLTWCQSHDCKEDETRYFEKEEINAMSEFDFVFLLSLRDCSGECDIDQMIQKQIIIHLAHRYDEIETVLSEDKCLVILDGLDEWTHPKALCEYGESDIPHRKARNWTILTTTRPWKLTNIKLKSSDIDQKLELNGLSETSREKLKNSVITLLSHETKKTINDQIEEFNNTVAEKGVSELESVPLLSMYLLCLWCEGIDLGRSKCLIHCQIIELLLNRTFERYPEMQSICLPSTSVIPQCFAAQNNCEENYEFLLALGQLAFETMFSKTRDNTLVFESSLVDNYLNKAFIELSLRSGIITQDKESNLTSKTRKSSFSNKTVQEFFAALYISTFSDKDCVLKKVNSLCNSVKDILEMSNVFIFVSGINADRFASVSEKLNKVINEDDITSTYRSVTWPLFLNNEQTLKQIQDMYISCLKEIPENSDCKFCLQDFIFDRTCKKEQYYTYLQRLAVQSKSNISSINMKIEGIRNVSEIIAACELSDINCQKIYYRGECEKNELMPLLHVSRSVKCATILSNEWRVDHFIGKKSFWCSEFSTIFQRNNQLEAINIQCFNFGHDVLEEFLNYFANRKSMKEIALFKLSCTDKEHDSCPGFRLDLSQHTELRRLGLNKIPLLQLNLNVSLLEECYVGEFPKKDMVVSYLNKLSAANKLHTFKCGYLKTPNDIETMLNTLSLLTQVRTVRLYEMNLGESILPCKMVNIKRVLLSGVTVSSSSLEDLVTWIRKQVTVELCNCKITPEIAFKKFKEYIQTSEKFVVWRDGILKDSRYSFAFKRII